jgi:hypothetical protein
MKLSALSSWIDWILRIIQIVTFIGVILKVTFNQNYYSDNVSLEKIELEDFDSLNNRFEFIHEYDYIKEYPHVNYFLLYPKNVDIKRLDFIDILYGKNGKEIEKLRESKTNIRNHTCIVISTILPEGAPFFKVRWETSTGEIGEYVFRYNGFNGNSDSPSYKTKLTIKRKIMMIFSLK